MEKEIGTQKRTFESNDELGEVEFLSTQAVESAQAIRNTQATSISKRAKKQKISKGKEVKRTKSKEVRQTMDITSNFHGVSTKFGTFIQDMNTHLTIMANAWSKSLALEKEMAEKSNKVVNNLLELEGLSQVEVMQAAETLIAEPNKLVVFYQLPLQLRRQYVVNHVLHGGPSK
ncbi:hypothetical protein Ancab_029793 [Ancistrocladus abbreviatus]